MSKSPFQKSDRLIRQSKRSVLPRRWISACHDAESLSSAPIRRRLLMSAGWTQTCQQIYSVLCQIQNEAWDLDFLYSWETLLSLRAAFSLFPSLELGDRLPEQTNMSLLLLVDWRDLLSFWPNSQTQKSMKTFSNTRVFVSLLRCVFWHVCQLSSSSPLTQPWFLPLSLWADVCAALMGVFDFSQHTNIHNHSYS